MTKRTEADLARPVVTELQRQGYVTYEEVKIGYGDRRADIVAVRKPIVAVVECKTSCSLRLLDQLTAWQGFAHYIIGAVAPQRVSRAAFDYCQHRGFGLWVVTAAYTETPNLQVRVKAQLHRKAATAWTAKGLRAEQQSAEYAAAGTQGGGYWTPFRGTCNSLIEVAKRTPGIELRLALKEAGHHYASDRSAMSSIPLLIRRGVIQGLRTEGKPLRLYPCEACAEGREHVGPRVERQTSAAEQLGHSGYLVVTPEKNNEVKP